MSSRIATSSERLCAASIIRLRLLAFKPATDSTMKTTVFSARAAPNGRRRWAILSSPPVICPRSCSWARAGAPTVPAPRRRSSTQGGLEAVPHPGRQRARRDDVRPSEDRLDVVDALLVEGVQQIDLKGQRRVVAVQVEAGREVVDRPGLDAVRIEALTAVDADERRREEVVRIGRQGGRVGVGHQARVVANIRPYPEAALVEVVGPAGLDLKILVVVDQELAGGEIADRRLVEEETAHRRGPVDRPSMAGGNEPLHARCLGHVEPDVPAVEAAVRKGERKDDPRVEELILVAGEM